MQNSTILEGISGIRTVSELEDEELVRLLAIGQTEAMSVIFDRHYALMMRVALRIIRNRAEAEDIIQIAFTDFYRQIKIFDGEKGSLRAWLLQYTYGRSINRLKGLRRRRHSDHVELSEVSPSQLVTPDEGVFDLSGPETRRLVEQALETLDGKKRRIVELVCFGGMTIAEVAAVTGEPHGRLQHRYYRAIDKLRAWLKKAEAAEREKSKPGREDPTSKKVRRKLRSEASIESTEAGIGKAQIF
jgi:RNA polymerase sigma-70 factor (ECF subfamily)